MVKSGELWAGFEPDIRAGAADRAAAWSFVEASDAAAHVAALAPCAGACGVGFDEADLQDGLCVECAYLCVGVRDKHTDAELAFHHPLYVIH